MVKNIFTWLSSLKGDKPLKAEESSQVNEPVKEEELQKVDENKEWNLFLDVLTVTREEIIKNPSLVPLKVSDKTANRMTGVNNIINRGVSDDEDIIKIEVMSDAIINLFLDKYADNLPQLRKDLQQRFEEQGYIPYINKRHEREKDDLIKQYEAKIQQMQNSFEDQIKNAVDSKNEELNQVKERLQEVQNSVQEQIKNAVDAETGELKEQIKYKEAALASQKLEVDNLKKTKDEMIKYVPDSFKKQQ